MRRAALVVASTLVAALSACSLLTSLSGYSDGDGTTDAASDTSSNPTDGSSGSDGQSTDGGGVDATDAGPSRSALYAQAVLADNPLGYWRLEETTGDVAKDETGRHDGQCFDAPLRGEPGIAGSRGMRFPSGKSARMVVASDAYAFGNNAAHTIEMWAKPGAFRNFLWLATTETKVSGGRNGWSLLADVEGKVLYEMWNADGDGGTAVRRGASTKAVSPGAFAHIVIVYDGTAATAAFLDGVRFGGFGTNVAFPSDGELTWGCYTGGSGCLDEWVIDELAIYAIALAEPRIQAHFQLGN